MPRLPRQAIKAQWEVQEKKETENERTKKRRKRYGERKRKEKKREEKRETDLLLIPLELSGLSQTSCGTPLRSFPALLLSSSPHLLVLPLIFTLWDYNKV